MRLGKRLKLYKEKKLEYICDLQASERTILNFGDIHIILKNMSVECFLRILVETIIFLEKTYSI